MKTHLKIGSRAYVDGKDEVIIRSVWVNGSFFCDSPHYRVDFVDLEEGRDVVVPLSRVGVEKKV